MSEVRIKLQFGSFVVDVSGGETYVEKKLEELIKKYGPGISAAAEVGTSKSLSGKNVSPSEFIKKLPIKNQTDRALALAYFLEKIRGKTDFTTGELAEVSREAKQSSFTNVSDTIARAIQYGYLMGAGERDGARAYVLTTTGEEFLEANLLNKK